MLKAFKLYGEAMEVVIPPKRDKWGRRFGFVRFSNVGDPRVFAIKLDNIIFGAKKIHVNIPRFQRERQQQSLQSKGGQQREKLHVNDQHPRRIQGWRKKEDDAKGGRKTERQTYSKWGWKKENHNEKHEIPKIIYHRKNNISEVCYTAPEEDMQKFRKMYIGTVRTPGSTYHVHEWFSMQGFFQIKVTPLGANKVLLEEMEEGVIQDLMKEYYDWLYEKFEGIRGWNPDDVDNERVVWVRCHGVPIHAWNEDFFASLARNFGVFLGVDEATRKKTAMDIARIRLRSRGYDVFNAVVTANINGSLFHIKMVEEWGGPLHWFDNKRENEDETDRDDDVSDRSSDSDDSHGGGPPLLTVENEWCSKEEEGWEEEGFPADESQTENEEEREEENNEVSMVQETFDIFKERKQCMEESNDYVGGRVEKTAGKQSELIGEIIKEGAGESEEARLGVRELTHVSNTGGCGGPQIEVSEGEVNEENKYATGGISEEGGCKKDDDPVISKKIRVEDGPGKRPNAVMVLGENNWEKGGASKAGGVKRMIVKHVLKNKEERRARGYGIQSQEKETEEE